MTSETTLLTIARCGMLSGVVGAALYRLRARAPAAYALVPVRVKRRRRQP